MILFIPNVYASTLAYSVGSKYASTIDSNQSDFTENVKNAAEGYYPHSTLTASYYSTNPTYSYLNGTKLGGSRVFFINGHANSSSILTASKDSTEYRTGLSISSTNPNYVTTSFNNKEFKLVGFGNRSFAATNIISFVGCSTDSGNVTLTKKAVSNGANVAVGFKNSIASRFEDGPDWLKKYNYSLGAGNSVDTAIEQASTTYTNTNLVTYLSVVGDGNTTIGTTNNYSLALSLEKVDESYNETKLINPNIDIEMYNEVRIDINELYQSVSNNKINTIDVKSLNDIELDDLSNYKTIFKPIIDEILLFDNQFDVSDYKVMYNLINKEEGFGILNFYYYIDGIIETNKVYSIIIKNFDITTIKLAGVKKINVNNIDDVNENNLKNKIQIFENNKIKNISEMTDLKFGNEQKSLQNNKLTLNNFDYTVKKVEEKYFYDYNNDILKYNILLTIENNNLFYEIESYEIEL